MPEGRGLPLNDEGVLVQHQVCANVQVLVRHDVPHLLALGHLPALQELAPWEAVCGVLKHRDAVVRHEVADHELALGGAPSVTWTQIADMVGKTVGQTLPVNYVRMGEKVPLLPDVMVQLLYATETYETHIDMSEICQSLNLRLTPLENVIQGMFGNRAN